MCILDRGNIKDPNAVPALAKALTSKEVLIRQHAAWALGQIGGTTAYRTLQSAYAKEKNEEVKQEISLSLKDIELR